VDVVLVGVEATVVVGIVVWVSVVAEVDVPQDAKTSDVNMRQVSIVQIVPFFIRSSYYLMETYWKFVYILISRIFLKYINPYQ